ncbi:Siroheme synthase [compost metagenome]
MGRTVAASVAERLMQAGLPAETTVAVIENASHADRRLLHGTLKDLPDLENRTELSGPVMVIIGDAVAGANFERSEPLVVGKARDAKRIVEVALGRNEQILN